MYILALDSTAKTMTAALSEDGRLLGEITWNAANTHSETLLPAVEQLFSRFSVTAKDIGLYALTKGPGSFTGVRIGAATVKGLAFSLPDEPAAPVAAVSATEALAWAFSGLFEEDRPALIVPVMDARRAQVYAALYTVGSGEPVRLSEDAALPLDELLDTVASRTNPSAPVFFCGDGYALAAARCRERGLAFFRETPEALRWPRGIGIALCGLAAWKRGETVTAEKLLPLYLRPSQAERNYQESPAAQKSGE